MLRFKQFITEVHTSQQNDVKKSQTKEKIPAVILNPDYDDLKQKFIEKEKKERNNLKESARESLTQPYDTRHLEDWLHKRYNDFTPDELNNINNYSRHSFHLNGHLLASHHLGTEPHPSPKFEKTGRQYNLGVMDNMLTRKPLGRKMAVFSGLGFDPRTQMTKSGHIHFPAYTSTSISPQAANSFARENKDDHEDKHMLRIQLNPHDKGAYIGTPSGYIHEREFVLPRNTTLRIHRSERSKEDPSVWIHHAVIDNDIELRQIERNPEIIHGLHENFHEAFHNEPTNKEISKKLNQQYIENFKKNPNVYSSLALSVLARRSDDPEIHKAIVNHENVDNRALSVLARRSDDPEIHKAIVNHKNTGIKTLSEIANKSDDPEIHKAIANNENANYDTLISLINKSNDPEIHKAIANNENAGDYTLTTLANKSDDPEIHKAIANHKNAGEYALSTLANKSDDPEIHKAIANNGNAGESALSTLANKTNDPEIHKAIVNHKNTNYHTLQKISVNHGFSEYIPSKRKFSYSEHGIYDNNNEQHRNKLNSLIDAEIERQRPFKQQKAKETEQYAKRLERAKNKPTTQKPGSDNPYIIPQLTSRQRKQGMYETIKNILGK